MAPSDPREDRVFDLTGHVTDAIGDLLDAAKACERPEARACLTDEVMHLFEAASELCRAMREFAVASRDRATPPAGIINRRRISSEDASHRSLRPR